jgi:hypothetical protein
MPITRGQGNEQVKPPALQVCETNIRGQGNEQVKQSAQQGRETNIRGQGNEQVKQSAQQGRETNHADHSLWLSVRQPRKSARRIIPFDMPQHRQR